MFIITIYMSGIKVPYKKCVQQSCIDTDVDKSSTAHSGIIDDCVVVLEKNNWSFQIFNLH